MKSDEDNNLIFIRSGRRLECWIPDLRLLEYQMFTPFY